MRLAMFRHPDLFMRIHRQCFLAWIEKLSEMSWGNASSFEQAQHRTEKKNSDCQGSRFWTQGF
jgi:hypothetical protein